MKKLHRLLYILIFTLSLFDSPVSAGESQKVTVDRAIMVLYVATMKVDSDHAATYSKLLTDTVRAELGKSSKYKLANPESDQSVEQAKNFNETCLSIEECARKEAKAVDADLVLISDVARVEGQCRVSMRLENIYSKEIIKTKNLRASCAIDDLESKVVELVYLIMKNDVSTGSGKRQARITSDPPGAKVTINNEFVGNTPIDSKITTGQVRIMMEFEGTDLYAPILVNELVEDSQALFVYHKVFAEKNAFLILTVNPPLSSILIDKKLIDNSNLKRLPVEIRKEHSIVVSKPKYETQTLNTPSLEPDQEYKLDIKLIPNPCSLSISSNPTGSAVLKNSNKVGNTPYKEQIMPGDHQYSVQRQFYDPQNISFYCAPEQIVQRAITLNRSKYTEEEQDRINNASKWRTTSYYGYGLSVLIAAGSYTCYSDYKKYDDQYKASTNPYEMESLKTKRDEAKNLYIGLAAGSAVSFGLSYLFYKWGAFPEDLLQRNSITVQPKPDGADVGWHLSW